MSITFKAFSEGEARDADGKWTGSGGGGYAGVSHYDSRVGEHAVFKHGGKAISGKIVGKVRPPEGGPHTHLLVQAHDGSGLFKVGDGAHHGTFSGMARAKNTGKRMNGA